MKKEMCVPVEYFYPMANLPKYGTENSAGADLSSVHAVVLPPYEQRKVATGVAVALPEGTVGLIWPRSSLAAKFNLSVMAGVIDCDYRNEIIVILRNHGSSLINLAKGERIAQLIVQPYIKADFQEVHAIEKDTSREGGFGSTGRM